MDIIENKYYEGYEGEAEIQFIRLLENGQKFILRIWYGYFYFIMEAIKPDKEGWTGLAYYHNLHEGWYDESPWEIANINEAIKQFHNVDKSNLNAETQQVLNEICQLFIESISANNKVFIVYE